MEAKWRYLDDKCMATSFQTPYPIRQINKTARSWLQQNWRTVGYTREAQISEGSVELYFLAGQFLHSLAERLERGVQLVPQFPFSLKSNFANKSMYV